MISPAMATWVMTALLLSLGEAQDTVTSYLTSETPTTTVAPPNTFTVAVGRGGHTFSPDIVQASVGDIIEFDFFPPNHSVVRAEYLLPCVPIEMTGPKVGFFSGFHPVDAILADPPKWTVQVNDTQPIFYYCSAPGSCVDWGMVGVINPNATTSLETQRELAKNASFQLNPGEPWPVESSSTTAGYTYAPTTTSTPSTSVPNNPAQTTAADPVSASSSSHALSTGAIAGIAIGGAAVLLIAGFLIWYCGRQSRNNSSNEKLGADSPPTYVGPAYNNYQPMSPSAKHISGITASSAQPSPGFPIYPYDQQQQHMAPFGAGQATSPQHGPQQYFPQQPHTSPHSAAFGAPLMQPQMSDNPMGPAVEVDSSRGHSPSPQPIHASGIEAFLARQGRMSPSNTNTQGSESDATGPSIRGHVGSPGPGVGPYEMSAGNTNSWQRR